MSQRRGRPETGLTARRSRAARGLAVAVLGGLGLLASAGRAAAETTVLSNATPITITDNAAAGTYPSTINVAGLSGPVTRVSVTLKGLSHPTPEDLDVLLVGPGGQRVFLMGDAGRSDAVTDVTLTFDDSGPPLPNRRIASGTFRPTNKNDRGGGNDTFPPPAPGGPYGTTLAVFNGTNPSGDWRLYIRDDHAGDAGALAGGWCLAITTGAGAPSGGCTPILTVVKVGQGTVTSASRGIRCGSDCQESYVDGTVVTLRAVAASSFVFAGWSGGGCSGTGSCVLTVTSAVTVTATFQSPAGTSVLSVTREGNGTVTSVPTGIDCGSDCTEAFPAGSDVTLAAVPAPSFIFAGWAGECTGTGPCQVTMDRARAVTAIFTAPPSTFTLTVSTIGAGTVTSESAGIDCGADCTEAYPAGTEVTLTASPAGSFAFSGWSGSGCSGNGACVVTLDQDRAVTATFAAPPGEVTLTVATEGAGAVTSVPPGISCPTDCTEAFPDETSLVLTATPGPSFVFAGWDGAGCTGTDPCPVTMSDDEEVTATFTAPPGAFILKVVTTGAGTVASNPGGIDCGSDCTEAFAAGTPVTLTATPGPSLVFAGWSGGGCAGTGPCVVTMTADVEVSASFVAPAGSFTLAVLKAGTGAGTVTSAPAGIGCGADCVQAYPDGAVVTLTATPDPSFGFTGWSGGGCAGTGPCVITMTADVQVTAAFSAPAGAFSLKVLKIGSGVGSVTSAPAGIDCGDDCAQAYPAGASVGLRAAPDPSFVFLGWSGGGCAGTDACTVTLDGHVTVSAAFGAPAGTFSLRVIRTGLGLGRVTGQPDGIACGGDCAEAYPAGTGVTLAAAGRRGSAFAGWSGGGCTGTGPCGLTVTADSLLSAAFDPPGDRPLITAPEEDDPAAAPGDPFSLAWVGLARATQYGVEFSGPNRPFTNPRGAGPDGVNGFGGAGGGFIVAGLDLVIAVPPVIAPGAYQLRVVGLAPDSTLVGRMSDAVTVLVGGGPGEGPTITTPAAGTPVPRGGSLTIAWTPVGGADQYLVTFEGGPDPGMIGGGFPVPVNAIAVGIPPETPPGEYRVRVLGLTAFGAPVGAFSADLTLVIQ